MIMQRSTITESGRVSFTRLVRGRVETAYVRPHYGMRIRGRDSARAWKVVGVDLLNGEMTLVDADRHPGETLIARTVPIGPHWTTESLGGTRQIPHGA